MNELKNVPNHRIDDQHLWADYIEMLCCWDADRLISKSRFIDIVRPEEIDLISGDETHESAAEEDDKYAARTDELFRFFEFRSNLYGNSYPFKLERGVLYLKEEALDSSIHLLYIYLLCCSNLSYFNKKVERPLLTTEFEVISQIATKNILPTNSTIHLVGKNSLGGESVYKGKLYNKLVMISKDLGEQLIVSEDEFPITDSGDGGLDLLGWINFEDSLNSRIVFVAQSKCSPEWYRPKSAGQMMRSYMNLNNPPNDLYFIPFCFRKLGHKWHQSRRLRDLVLFDRVRIMRSLKDNPKEFTSKSKSIPLILELLKEPTEII